MKRVISIICMLVFILSITQFSSADTLKTEYIKDIDLSIDLPSDYIIYHRQMEINDSELSRYGYSSDEIAEVHSVLDSNTYICALDKNHTNSIRVMMFPLYQDSEEDYALKSDSVLLSGEDSNAASYKEIGIDLEKYSVFYHSQTKFVKEHMNAVVDGEKRQSIMYSTIYGGNGYYIGLRSYSGEIDSARERFIDNIVTSIKLETNTITSKHNYYHESESDLYFAIPDTWKEDFNTPKAEGIDAIFITDRKPGLSIHVACRDAWAEFSPSERQGMTRADLNNSAFTISDIAEAFHVSSKNVSMESHNGVSYFMLDSVQTSSGISFPAVMAIRWENGFLYIFMISDTKDGVYYKDFVTLLDSATYKTDAATHTSSSLKPTNKPTATPTPKPTEVPVTATPMATVQQSVENASTDYLGIVKGWISSITWLHLGAYVLFAMIPAFISLKKGRSFFGFLFLGLVITPVIALIIILCLKKRINNRSSQQGDGDEGKAAFAESNGQLAPASDNSKEADKSEPSEQLVFCRYCGFKLLEGSDFCSHCGKKVK